MRFPSGANGGQGREEGSGTAGMDVGAVSMEPVTEPEGTWEGQGRKGAGELEELGHGTAWVQERGKPEGRAAPGKTEEWPTPRCFLIPFVLTFHLSLFLSAFPALAAPCARTVRVTELEGSLPVLPSSDGCLLLPDHLSGAALSTCGYSIYRN